MAGKTHYFLEIKNISTITNETIGLSKKIKGPILISSAQALNVLFNDL